MDIPHLAREAFTRLSTASALRKAGRTADAIASAELARRRLVDAVRAVEGLVAELRAEAEPPTEPAQEVVPVMPIVHGR